MKLDGVCTLYSCQRPNQNPTVIAGTPFVHAVQGSSADTVVEAAGGENVVQLQASGFRRVAGIIGNHIAGILGQVFRCRVGAPSIGMLRSNVFQAEGVHAVKDGGGAKGEFTSSAPEVKIHVEVAGGQDPVVWIVFIAAEHWRVDEYRQIGDYAMR